MLVGVAPTRAEVDPALVHPLSDAQGRPCVRVLVLGALAQKNATARGFAKLTGAHSGRLGTWSSAKRQYSFEIAHPWEVQSSDDPAHPMIAMVYAPFARKNAPLDDALHLWSYSAIGYRAPLLWLLGIKESKARDENVLRCRAHVDRSGYVADECPIVCAPTMSAASLDALVIALDEHFDASELLVRESPALRIARALMGLVRENGALSWDGYSWIVARSMWGHTSESDAVLAELCALFIERGQCDHAAKLLGNRAVRDRALFERWLALERSRATVAPLFDVLAALYRFSELDREAALAHCRALIESATNPTRVRALRERMAFIENVRPKATIEESP